MPYRENQHIPHIYNSTHAHEHDEVRQECLDAQRFNKRIKWEMLPTCRTEALLDAGGRLKKAVRVASLLHPSY
jgi:hypothetical protein